MFTIKILWAVLRSPIARYVGVALAISGLCWWGYMAIDSRGYARAERACQMAEAKDASQLLLDAIQAKEEAHQFTLAEQEKGEMLSKQLSVTQRKLNETKTEYLTYANAIVGNCPDSLRVFMSYPSPSNSEGTHQGTPPSTSVDSSATVDAAPIGANIAINRYAFEYNYAQCTALLIWHQKGDVK